MVVSCAEVQRITNLKTDEYVGISKLPLCEGCIVPNILIQPQSFNPLTNTNLGPIIST